MWKDFLYFSRSDRRAIVVLLAVLAVLWAGTGYVNRRHAVTPTPADRAELDSFLASVTRTERTRPSYDTHEARSFSPREAELFVFDPNTADSLTLRRLGLPPYVARNVIKYRAHGGTFRTPHAFARIYGLTEAQYKRLEPYIKIGTQQSKRQQEEADAPILTAQAERPDTQHPEREKPAEKQPEDTPVDLNTADAATLQRVSGIGAYRARLILDYRNRLGGYVSTEQLREIEGLPGELLSRFTVNTPPSPGVRINKGSVEQLRRHPYLTFYQAKIIVEHRRKYGDLKDLSPLALYPEFSEEALQRLEPYVRFD